MKITKKQLKQIIREELRHTINEGPLSDAQSKIPRNTGNVFLDAFHTLENLSGPEASLTNWVANAQSKAKDGNREAARALDAVRAAFRKEKELAENEEGMSLGDRRRAASKQIGDKIKQMDHYINMQPSLVNLQDIQDMIPMDLRMDVEDVSNNLMNYSEYDSVVDFLDFVMRRR